MPHEVLLIIASVLKLSWCNQFIGHGKSINLL